MEENGKQGGCAIYVVVWIVAALLLGVFFYSINKTGQGVGSIIFVSVLIGSMIALMVFCFNMVVLTSRIQRMARYQRQQDKASGITRYYDILHMGGLTAPVNCKCTVLLKPEGLIVECGGNEFFLRLEKIRNVDFQLDIDKSQYLQGYMIREEAETAILGRRRAFVSPQLKTTREVKCYAIISYENDEGEYQTFILRDTLPNTQNCSKLVDTLKARVNTQLNRINL